MSDSLIPIESVNAVEIFTGGGLDSLLTRIRQETVTMVTDVTTVAGRKEIASLAYKVARSKTAIDDAGKELVADWKKKSAEVDAARKKARDYLDGLRDEVRKPLDDWEAEQDRIEAEKLAEIQRQKAEEEAARLAELERREAEIRAKEEAFRKTEEEARAKAAAEQAERDRVAREDAIRAEAEAKAKRDAEEAVRAAERAAQEAQERERLAAERAEQEKAEAVRQAELKAQREAEERERARLAEEARVKAEEERKAANKAHQQRINKAAVAALIQYAGLDEETAKKVVIAIATKQVPAVSINY